DTASAYAKARRDDGAHPADLRLDAMRPYCTPSPGVEGETTHTPPLLLFASDYDQIVSAVSFAAERGVPAAIVGGRDAPLCAELLKEHNIPVIINGVYPFPKRADSPHDEAYTLPARLHAAGVRFCISGADRDGNVRNLPYEAAMAARYGLDRDAAIRAITLTPAEILGVDGDYGSIEQGKSATLIVTTGDVLEITSNGELAWIDGREIELRSKQTELRDKYVEKYRQLGIIEE
ncbi:MAG: amidohydrolase family protein, partial [Phycisphaerales bacterium]|nr:amidohydrolase family protein [Phycisphaerales bacterium]